MRAPSLWQLLSAFASPLSEIEQSLRELRVQRARIST